MFYNNWTAHGIVHGRHHGVNHERCHGHRPWTTPCRPWTTPRHRPWNMIWRRPRHGIVHGRCHGRSNSCRSPVCGHHLSPGIGIVSSLQSAFVCQISACPILVFFPHLPIQHIPFLLVHFTFSLDTASILALPQGHVCASSPSSSRLLVYLFLLSGRSSPLHEIAVSAFSRSPFGLLHPFSFMGRGGRQMNK